MDKIDPRLAVLLSKQQLRRKSVITAEEQEPQPLPEFVGALVKVKTSADFLTALGCQVTTVLGNYASVRIPLNKLEEVVTHPEVERIETNRGYKPDLDDSIGEIKANNLRNSSPPFSGTGKFTGKDVIVGIIDFGFKFTHKVFRDPNDPTKSRILFLMDQSLTPQGGETAPTNGAGNPMSGVEYSKANIEAAIAAADPSTVVRHVPDGHGTHVAGIAAGNGAQSGNCHGTYHYVGVAPEADLILVRLSSGSNQIGESNNLIDAIDYIRRKAESLGKPAVINMSLGDNLGAHDGTSMAEIMIDLELVLFPTGFTIVKSAGNQGSEKKHAQGNVAANNAANPLLLKFQVFAPWSSSNDTSIEIDIWYPEANSLNCTVKPPGNNVTGTNNATPGNTTTFTENTQNSSITIDNRDAQANSKKRIFITINPPANGNNVTGEWTIELVNTTGTQAPFDAWIERDQLAEFNTHETNARTISIPGTSQEVITVGNYLCKGKDKGKIATSSSRGPTTDARTKPEISAPGTDIISARHDPDAGSCCDCCYDFYTAKSGTSMAAPHVAGAIALMLEKNPTLTHSEIKNHLIATAVKDSFTGNSANDNFGHGKLDVAAALAAVAAAAPRSALAAGPTEEEQVPPPLLQQAEPSAQLLFAEGSPIARFVATPQGKELHLLAMKHYREVRDLVNTNKRVATVWHRNDGPLLAHHVIRCSMMPDATLPMEIEGTSVLSRLENIIAALKEHGSEELQTALDVAMPLAAELPGRSFFQVVELVEEGSLA